MQSGSSALGLARRLAFVGVASSDDEEMRAQKAVLTLAASIVTVLAIIWVGMYWVLGLHRAAALQMQAEFGRLCQPPGPRVSVR